MIPLTDNPSVSTYYHCPHHRVGLRILLAILSQLDAALHKPLIVSHHTQIVLTLQK
jgi:hypothetical protein